MEIKGTIHSIGQTQVIGEKGFKKREFVITYAENPEYPEYRKLELIQDKCDLLDNFKAGQEVTCQSNLKGRLWVDPQGVEKCFNTDQVWKIDSTGKTANNSDDESGNNLPF